ncbi:MAG: metallophosphoesterase [Firmicutes bacterium]|nr:metallophosphoesterase [Bacillota bacterium]
MFWPGLEKANGVKAVRGKLMRYYVTADVHGYFSELNVALAEKGFFEDKEPHKLIICGDIYDRGTEALELQNFILDLMLREKVILIRGNHEDLALELLNNWNKGSFLQRYHHSNGTVDTVLQLTETTIEQLSTESDEIYKKLSKNPFIQNIIPAMVDFYETEHYIFTHGWIPCTIIGNNYSKKYFPIEEWRNAGVQAWNSARWINGMEAAHNKIIEKDKTIICGHWHCSFGHSRYEGDGGEFDNNPNFTPYYGEGVIALDACTPVSRVVNCIVVED